MKEKSVWGLRFLASLVVVTPVIDAGFAHASPPFYGLTFADAAEKVKNFGGTPAVATVIGSQLATEECVVVNSRPSKTLDSQGQTAHAGLWLFDLNCNRVLAEPGKAGNSVASEMGATAKKIKGFIAYWNDGHFDSCGASIDSAKWCQLQCDKYGGCSAEFEQFLSSQF